MIHPEPGVVASTLWLHRNGAVGFIDWLGPLWVILCTLAHQVRG
jgi:hypothetical protein